MAGKKKQNKKIQKQKKFFKSRIVKTLIYTGISLFIVGLGSFYWLDLNHLPNPNMLKANISPQTTIIRDRKERILYKVYKDENRISLNYEEIPDIVKNATIAIEDSGFYQHPGISVKSMFRALLNNMRRRDSNQLQGASTITQQLVKNKLLTSERSYKRKIKEIILALWTERIYSKKEILTMYLNEISYGGPAYGIETASETFFNKHAQNLTLAEAAYLSGLPVSPETFSLIGANPELAINRQTQVLERMVKLSMISKEQFEHAKNENLIFAQQKIGILAPHFVMYVKNQLVKQYGEDVINQGGLDVVTTLDLDIQKKTEEIIAKQITKTKKSFNISNGAALVTNPQSGEILAMIGSVDYFDLQNKGNVNVTTSLRQPGSAIKPVNYGYAFDHGFSPASVIEDSPVVYVTAGAKNFSPANYDGKFHGNVTLRSALANSYNIPAVKILNSYGVDKMLDMGRKLGIESWDNSPQIGLSLTLGSLEVTMVDLARAYGTIANTGIKKELKSIKVVKDHQNRDITGSFNQAESKYSFIDQVQAAEEDSPQVISPLSAYWVTDILSDNHARQNTFGSYSKLIIPKHQVAVKTGTSNDFRDNWTIGFTPDYLVAVWVGNNDGSFMNKKLVSGVTGAAPIWNEIMTNVLADSPPQKFSKPSHLVPVTICEENGLLTCSNCPEVTVEYFPVAEGPTETCNFRPAAECEEAKKQSEGKNDEERKLLLFDCPFQYSQ